jgi:hypothetical protein
VGDARARTGWRVEGFAVRRGAGPVDALAWVVAYMALLTALLFARFRAGAWRRMDLAGAEPTVD